MSPMTLTTGRSIGTLAALVALAGVIVGVRALVRRRAAMAALLCGLIGLAGGGAVVATADGGPGTGEGIVGGFAACALGLIAGVLGGVAMARSRRADNARHPA